MPGKTGKMGVSSLGGGVDGWAGSLWGCFVFVLYGVTGWQRTISCLVLCLGAGRGVGGVRRELEAGLPLLTVVSSSLGILIRQKYFPVSSLQTLTRSQLQVVAAFLLLGITMSSLPEPLVTHLLQHAIHGSRGSRVEEVEGRAREEMEGKSPLQRTGRQKMPSALGQSSPFPNGHLESSGNLGPAVCEAQTSSNRVWK